MNDVMLDRLCFAAFGFHISDLNNHANHKSILKTFSLTHSNLAGDEIEYNFNYYVNRLKSLSTISTSQVDNINPSAIDTGNNI